MSSDPNKKNPRTFQCRDSLWNKFEQMARELECSVDYLINDAMKQYARQRGYGTAAGSLATRPSLTPNSSPIGAIGSQSAPTIPSSKPHAVPVPPPPPPPVSQTGGGLHSVSAAPAPPARPPIAAPPPPPAPSRRAPPPPGSLSARRAPPPPPMGAPRISAPPPIPSPAHAPAQRISQAPLGLAIFYQGEMFQVTKDRFIIGRGKQSSDLTIKDPNVSRQHAMIEFLNGQYYIVDMGSTNGVEYNGQRVQRKVINDGDMFRVCDHELRFAFQSAG